MRLSIALVLFIVAVTMLFGCANGKAEKSQAEKISLGKATITSNCEDVYPTDIQPSDVKYRDRYCAISLPPADEPGEDPFFATGINIKGVEPTSSAETTRIALFTDEIPDFIRFKGEAIDMEESWGFENKQHIVIYLVPNELVTERLWEEVEVELYPDKPSPPPDF